MFKNFKYNKWILLLVYLFTITGCSRNRGNYDGNYDMMNSDGNNHYSAQNFSTNLDDEGKSVFCEIGNIDGYFEVANADLSNSCSVKIHFEGSINSGKAKLVLVKPNKSVEILKEIISTENKTYSEDISVNCVPGTNKIKFIAENYSGSFKISQDDTRVFNYSRTMMFDDDLPKDFPFDYKN